MTISDKLGTKQRYKVCDVTNIDVLVTELDANEEKLNHFRNRGIEIL